MMSRWGMYKWFGTIIAKMLRGTWIEITGSESRDEVPKAVSFASILIGIIGMFRMQKGIIYI